MQHELECGHCGFQFALDGPPFPRSVQCSVCGGRLTIAVPLAPPTAPEPEPPKPILPLLPPKPAPPPVDEDGPVEPAPEGLWPIVSEWLDVARSATDFGRVLCALVVALDLLVCPLPFNAAPESAVTRLLILLGVVLVPPALIHAGVALIAAQTPPAYGGWLVRMCVGLLFLSPVAAGCANDGAKGNPAAVVNGAIFAAVAVCVVAAFVLWLRFLVRLGRSLRDDELAAAAKSCYVWFPFGLALTAMFLTGAAVAEEAAYKAPFAWFGRAAAGTVVIVSLRRYAALLRVAVVAIGRAPYR